MAEQQEPSTNRRVSPELAETIRQTRVREPWEIVDTIVVGQGANAIDPGWFNTFAQFATAQQIQWFRSRSSSVPLVDCNRSFDRSDFHFDIEQIHAEFIAPPVMYPVTFPPDQIAMPTYWTRQLAHEMAASFKISDTDEILSVGMAHLPAGAGPFGGSHNNMPNPTTDTATNGQPVWGNGWVLPEPIMIPRGATFVCRGYLAPQLQTYMALLTGGPGSDLLPGNNAAEQIFVPRWYRIRLRLVGARYVQMRGAMSAVT